jgi:hypothetical protein
MEKIPSRSFPIDFLIMNMEELNGRLTYTETVYFGQQHQLGLLGHKNWPQGA